MQGERCSKRDARTLPEIRRVGYLREEQGYRAGGESILGRCGGNPFPVRRSGRRRNGGRRGCMLRRDLVRKLPYPRTRSLACRARKQPIDFLELPERRLIVARFHKQTHSQLVPMFLK